MNNIIKKKIKYIFPIITIELFIFSIILTIFFQKNPGVFSFDLAINFGLSLFLVIIMILLSIIICFIIDFIIYLFTKRIYNKTNFLYFIIPFIPFLQYIIYRF